LRPGENIMIFPYGVNGPSMLWQAETNMYFSMSGGYIGPTPDEFARWPAVNAALFSLPLADPRTQLQTFVAAHKVEAIVVIDNASPLPTSLGIAPIRIGGAAVYQLAPGQSAAPPVAKLDRLEAAAAEQWIADLLQAAIQFLDSGHRLCDLNPSRLQRLGLLSDSKWGERVDMVLAGTSHGAINGLWIGPGPDSTLAVGIFASPATVAALVSHYKLDAARILYPYPSPYRAGATCCDNLGFMLMTIRADLARHMLENDPAADPLLRPAHDLISGGLCGHSD